MLIPDELDAAPAQARRKPIVDAVVNGVKCGVRTIYGDARGSTPQYGSLKRIGQCHGRERFEDGWMVRNDHRRRQG